MKKILSALTVVLCILSFASCNGGLVEFEFIDGKLINNDSDTAYLFAPVGFEPCGVGAEYGRHGEFSVYEVMGNDGTKFSPEEWLTEGYAGTASTLYYREDIAFVPFEETEHDAVYVCVEGDGTVASIATITDTALIKTLKDSLKGGDRLLPSDNIEDSFRLKFYSTDHPQYYFSVIYAVCTDGNFIYTRGAQTCVDIGDILTPYTGVIE